MHNLDYKKIKGISGSFQDVLLKAQMECPWRHATCASRSAGGDKQLIRSRLVHMPVKRSNDCFPSSPRLSKIWCIAWGTKLLQMAVCISKAQKGIHTRQYLPLAGQKKRISASPLKLRDLCRKEARKSSGRTCSRTASLPSSHSCLTSMKCDLACDVQEAKVYNELQTRPLNRQLSHLTLIQSCIKQENLVLGLIWPEKRRRREIIPAQRHQCTLGSKCKSSSRSCETQSSVETSAIGSFWSHTLQ